MTRLPPPFEIVLPASSANLGPGFDAAAIALNLYLKLRAEAAAAYSITAKGCDVEICVSLNKNLILETYEQVLLSQSKQPLPLAISIENDIPIGKGFGSSAAALLAGIALAVHFGELDWSDDRILEEACRIEGHPDNASACWLGGRTVARMRSDSTRDSQIQLDVVKMTISTSWPILLAVSDDFLATEKARAALPEAYSREDVVTNLQAAMVLLAAFTENRPEMLRSAMHDRLHEPYRSDLCPLLPALRPLAGGNGVLAAVLSGAGPSVLMILDPRESPASSKTKVESRLAEAGLSAQLALTAIALQGGRDLRATFQLAPKEK